MKNKIIKVLKKFYKSIYKNTPSNIFDAGVKYLLKKNYRISVQYSKYYKKLEIDDKKILYESFNGEKMCGNPLAIFNELLANENYKEYVHIWVLDNVENCRNEYIRLKNVYFIKKNTREYIKYLCSCKYLINNSTFPSYFIKKKRQIYINTWHGTPFKTLGKNMNGMKGQHKNI